MTGFRNHIGNRHGGIVTGCIEEVIGFFNPHLVEEHLVQLIVVVLPGMHQHMLGVFFQLCDDAA
jgi:hypothetical protein